jgi:hypothetical protein
MPSESFIVGQPELEDVDPIKFEDHDFVALATSFRVRRDSPKRKQQRSLKALRDTLA